MSNQLTAPNLQELNTSLQAIQPKSETASLITYTLIATAVVGIFVYHYIKGQENKFSDEKEVSIK